MKKGVNFEKLRDKKHIGTLIFLMQTMENIVGRSGRI